MFISYSSSSQKPEPQRTVARTSVGTPSMVSLGKRVLMIRDDVDVVAVAQRIMRGRAEFCYMWDNVYVFTHAKRRIGRKHYARPSGRKPYVWL